MVLRIQKIPTPRELKARFPLSVQSKQTIFQTRKTIEAILDKRDPRLLMIIGPCSLHDPDAVIQYARKLKEFSHSISDRFFLVMRAYFEKPRTETGWKGMLHDPAVDHTGDLSTGLTLTRELLTKIAELHLPIASELLEPACGTYFSDLLSWGCIGARTTTSQVHRQLASSLTLPIGFKNNIDGNIHSAINGVLSAGKPHSILMSNDDGQLVACYTSGNKNCHVVLRGSEHCPNYEPDAIAETATLLRAKNLPASMIVDCSHDNSRRNITRQKEILHHLVSQRTEGIEEIRGVILESFLERGCQVISAATEPSFGVSITDPCLGWDETEYLLATEAARFSECIETRSFHPCLSLS